MAQTIGTHGLYCPDPQDYAAYALYMQDVATRIDEQLAAQEALFDAFLNQPTIIVTNAVAKTIVSPDARTDIWDTTVYSNSPFLTYDFTTNRMLIGSVPGAPVTVPYSRGAYSTGATVSMSDVGATTAGTRRSVLLTVQDFTLPAVAPAIIDAVDGSDARGTGGEDLTAKTNFVLSGVSGVAISHSVFSGNVASNTSIMAGGFMWCTFNGATDVIEVA